VSEITTAPAIGLGLTLGVWLVVTRLGRRLGDPAWANPVLWSVVIIGALIVISRVPYVDYASSTSALTVFLGPAIVALALPVHHDFDVIASSRWGALATAIAAAAVSVAATVALAAVTGLQGSLIRALAPKHATSPVAAATAQLIGGDPGLAASLAVFSGVLTAALGPVLLDLVRIRDPRRRGLAYGIAGHAIGTSRAAQESSLSASFSVVGMVTAAIVVPLVCWLIFGPVGSSRLAAH